MNLQRIIKQFHLLLAERPLPLEKPKVVQFPVIDICNSRCQMCRIWENKQSRDITVDELKRGLANDLFSEVESIGFNGGEPTLRKDLAELVEVVVETLPQLKSVSLITNAFKYRQVIEQIDNVGKILKTGGLWFDVMVSLDGYQEVHDRVRGREGNFSNAQYVIDHIKKSPLVDSVRIGCTVIRENALELPDLLDYCIKNDLYVKFRQGVPHQRLYTENLEDPYALSYEEKYEFVEFLEGLIKHYESDSAQRFFYRSLADQIIKGAPRKAGCAWQHKGATITAKGELAYCAVKSPVLASNIAEDDAGKAYFDNENLLRNIISNDCDDCHHDYVGVPGKADYRRLVFERLEARLGLKRMAQAAPGFRFIQAWRQRRKFLQELVRLRTLPERIRLQSEPNGRNTPHVMICGWYGTETLGDKAIIGGIITVIRSQLGADVKISVASLNPYVTEMTRRQMEEFEGVDVVQVDEAVALAGTVDCLMFGGGPMMAIGTLAPIEVLFERAKASEVLTIAAGVGVGPLGNRWLNDSIARILKLCDERIYRDERSRLNAISLGVDAEEDVVAEDPAFTWLSHLTETRRSTDGGERRVLLLGLRDFPYREYAQGQDEVESRNIKEKYESVVISTLEALVEKDPSLVIRPLPMCTNHFGSDDRWFYRNLFRSVDGLQSNLDYSLLGPERPPLDYVSAFQSADALLAMRFHSLVFGLGVGLNSVAIDYTLGKGKVRSLADNHNVPVFDIRFLDEKKLESAISEALSSDTRMRLDLTQLSYAPALSNALKALSS